MSRKTDSHIEVQYWKLTKEETYVEGEDRLGIFLSEEWSTLGTCQPMKCLQGNQQRLYQSV